MTKRGKSYTVAQNLRLLADEGRPKKTPSGVVEFEHISRTALASRLGVSTRTLRRWLNEGNTPSPDNQKRIQQAGTGRRRAMKRAGLPDLARIPYGHRRELKQYDFSSGKPEWTGSFYASTWINYHVAGWTNSDMLALLESAQGYGNRVQFMYKINMGVWKGHRQQGATMQYDLDYYSLDELEEIIVGLQFQYQEDDDEEPNEIIWIGVLDPKAKLKPNYPK
jgi:transcriptional regulator with XRE-family HTH domain